MASGAGDKNDHRKKHRPCTRGPTGVGARRGRPCGHERRRWSLPSHDEPTKVKDRTFKTEGCGTRDESKALCERRAFSRHFHFHERISCAPFSNDESLRASLLNLLGADFSIAAPFRDGAEPQKSRAEKWQKVKQ